MWRLGVRTLGAGATDGF
uniref:Uncharacterized protein n=1 Tax=Anguilla anguilla TaxID=7936 RepID=A0A0E9TQE2_ANGAN